MKNYILNSILLMIFPGASIAQLIPFGFLNKVGIVETPATYSQITPGAGSWTSTCANGVIITAYGGGGGGGASINFGATGGNGGNGNVVTASLSNTYIPIGTVLSITVASGGIAGQTSSGTCATGPSGGSGGGGGGGTGTSCGGQGGGATSIYSTYLGNATNWLVAGGGGGGGGGHMGSVSAPASAGGNGGVAAASPASNGTGWCLNGAAGG